jgi:hypothetical protein
LAAIYSLEQGEGVAPPLEDIFTFKADENPTSVTYERIDETHYVAHVTTDTPFLLVFSEAYHPLWKAYIDGDEIESMPTNFFCNGFAIDKIGEYDVFIEYGGQRYASIGATISIAAWSASVACLGFLLIRDWRRRRRG